MRVKLTKLAQVLVAGLTVVLTVGLGINLVPAQAATAASAIPLTIEYLSRVTRDTTTAEGTVTPFNTTATSPTQPSVQPTSGSLPRGNTFSGIFFVGDDDAQMQITQLSATQDGNQYTAVFNQSDHPEVRLSFTGTAVQLRQHLVARYSVLDPSAVTINFTTPTDMTITSPYKSGAKQVIIPRSGGTFTFAAPRSVIYEVIPATNSGLEVSLIKDMSVDGTTSIQQWRLTPADNTPATTAINIVPRHLADGKTKFGATYLREDDISAPYTFVGDRVNYWPAFTADGPNQPAVDLVTNGNSVIQMNQSNNLTYNNSWRLRYDVRPPVYATPNTPATVDGKYPQTYFLQYLVVNGQRLPLPQPYIEPLSASAGQLNAQTVRNWYISQLTEMAKLQPLYYTGTGPNAGVNFMVRLSDARIALDRTLFNTAEEFTVGTNRDSLAIFSGGCSAPSGDSTTRVWASTWDKCLALANQWAFRYTIAIDRSRPSIYKDGKVYMTFGATVQAGDTRVIRNVNSDGITSGAGMQATASGTLSGPIADPGEIFSFGVQNSAGNADSDWTIYSPTGRPLGDLEQQNAKPGLIQDATLPTTSGGSVEKPSVQVRYQVMSGYANPVIRSTTVGPDAGVRPAVTSGDGGVSAYIPITEPLRSAVYTDANHNQTTIARIGQPQPISIVAPAMDINVYRQAINTTLVTRNLVTTTNIETAREITVPNQPSATGHEGQYFNGYLLYYAAPDSNELSPVGDAHYQPGEILFLDDIAQLQPLNALNGRRLVGAFTFVEDWGEAPLSAQSYTYSRILRTYAVNGSDASITDTPTTSTFEAVAGMVAEVINPRDQVVDGRTYKYQSDLSRPRIQLEEGTPLNALYTVHTYLPYPQFEETDPARTPVANPLALTESEKADVKAAILNAFPDVRAFLTDSDTAADFRLEVTDTGQVILTYPDGTSTPSSTPSSQTAPQNGYYYYRLNPLHTITAATPGPELAKQAVLPWTIGNLTNETAAALTTAAGYSAEAKDLLSETISRLVSGIEASYGTTGENPDPQVTLRADGSAAIGWSTGLQSSRTQTEVLVTNLLEPRLVAVEDTAALTADEQQQVALAALNAQYGQVRADKTAPNLSCTAPQAAQADGSRVFSCRVDAYLPGQSAISTRVSVSPTGEVTVTWMQADGSEGVSAQLPSELTVMPRHLQVAQRTAVGVDKTGQPHLNAAQQAEVAQAVRQANRLPEATAITVSVTGEVTVSIPAEYIHGATTALQLSLPSSQVLLQYQPVKVLAGADPGEQVAALQEQVRAHNPEVTGADSWTVTWNNEAGVYEVHAGAEQALVGSIAKDAALFYLPQLTAFTPQADGDPLSLEAGEQAAVLAALQAANPSAGLEENSLAFSSPADEDEYLTVTTANGGSVDLAAKEVVYPILQRPIPLFVDNANALSGSEKTAVVAKLKAVNPVLASFVPDSAIEISDDGIATVTFADATVTKLYGLALSKPAAILVKDPANLSDEEQALLVERFNANLPEGGTPASDVTISGGEVNFTGTTADSIPVSEVTVTLPQLTQSPDYPRIDSESTARSVANKLLQVNGLSSAQSCSAPFTYTGNAPTEPTVSPSWTFCGGNEETPAQVVVFGDGRTRIYFNNPTKYADLNLTQTIMPSVLNSPALLTVRHSLANLSEEEKDLILAAVQQANPDIDPSQATFSFDSRNAHVVASFGSGNGAPSIQIPTPVIILPDLTLVKPGQLTAEQKAAIADKIRVVPARYDTVVSDSGEVTITGNDTSTVLDPATTVVHQPALTPLADYASPTAEELAAGQAAALAKLPAGYTCENFTAEGDLTCGYGQAGGPLTQVITFTKADLFRPSDASLPLFALTAVHTFGQATPAKAQAIEEVLTDALSAANWPTTLEVEVQSDGSVWLEFVDGHQLTVENTLTTVALPQLTPVADIANPQPEEVALAQAKLTAAADTYTGPAFAALPPTEQSGRYSLQTTAEPPFTLLALDPRQLLVTLPEETGVLNPESLSASEKSAVAQRILYAAVHGQAPEGVNPQLPAVSASGSGFSASADDYAGYSVSVGADGAAILRTPSGQEAHYTSTQTVFLRPPTPPTPTPPAPTGGQPSGGLIPGGLGSGSGSGSGGLGGGLGGSGLDGLADSGAAAPAPSPASSPTLTPSPSPTSSPTPAPSASPAPTGDGSAKPAANPGEAGESRVIVAQGGQVVKLPENLIPVVNDQHLAGTEKARIIQELLRVNPQLVNNVKIQVDNMGNISLTFFDGTTLYIAAEKVIFEVASLPGSKTRGNLARTGQDIFLPALAAVLFGLTGWGMAFLLRRRRRSH